MKKHQEIWVEKLKEFSEGFKKPNMDNNLLSVCCEILGDDTGGTDTLSKTLASILSYYLIKKEYDRLRRDQPSK